MIRELRRTQNSKQNKIEVVKSQPSVNSLREGQEVIYISKSNRLERYRKEQGRLWTSYMDTDNSFKVDRNLNVGKDLNVGGNISGGQVNFFNHNYNAANSDKNFVPWGSISEASSINFYNNIIAPYSGRLLKVLVRCEEAIDTVAVGFHKSPDGTEAPNATATETITLEMGTDDITTEFNFTPVSFFDKGDVIAISIDPEQTANDVKVTSAWLFNIVL